MPSAHRPVEVGCYGRGVLHVHHPVYLATRRTSPPPPVLQTSSGGFLPVRKIIRQIHAFWMFLAKLWFFFYDSFLVKRTLDYFESLL